MGTRFNCVLLCLISFVNGKLEPIVVGGSFAHISHFPHSVFMSVHCLEENDIELSWICGGSILNQVITLTAAHCLYGCNQNSTVSVGVGHVHKDYGDHTTVHSYFIHEDYDVTLAINDIALVRLNTKLKFSENVKRIILMKHPPYHEKAQIAGWGITNVSSFLI
ncbi:trypsin delta-like [Trichoplusia ni]|uniref:Trypsin delta-like n=1 Tax=Trichoplusia ni TaxID=7111 RepID=A0A7E5VEQ9_TRINI|nr:trypsin delta-like [Trichoplusia ni]